MLTVKWWRQGSVVRYRQFMYLASAVRWANMCQCLGYQTEYPNLL